MAGRVWRYGPKLSLWAVYEAALTALVLVNIHGKAAKADPPFFTCLLIRHLCDGIGTI